MSPSDGPRSRASGSSYGNSHHGYSSGSSVQFSNSSMSGDDGPEIEEFDALRPPCDEKSPGSFNSLEDDAPARPSPDDRLRDNGCPSSYPDPETCGQRPSNPSPSPNYLTNNGFDDACPSNSPFNSSYNSRSSKPGGLRLQNFKSIALSHSS